MRNARSILKSKVLPTGYHRCQSESKIMEFPRIDPFGSITFVGGVGQITVQKLVIECGQGSIFDRTISFHLGKEGKVSPPQFRTRS